MHTAFLTHIDAMPSLASHGAQVVVDVNWRPVFWSDLEAAKKTVEAFIHSAGGGNIEKGCQMGPHMLQWTSAKRAEEGFILSAGGGTHHKRLPR